MQQALSDSVLRSSDAPYLLTLQTDGAGLEYREQNEQVSFMNCEAFDYSRSHTLIIKEGYGRVGDVRMSG